MGKTFFLVFALFNGCDLSSQSELTKGADHQLLLPEDLSFSQSLNSSFVHTLIDHIPVHDWESVNAIKLSLQETCPNSSSLNGSLFFLEENFNLETHGSSDLWVRWDSKESKNLALDNFSQGENLCF